MIPDVICRNQHATALTWNGKGFLLVGTPGCGKSSLAMRLIERGAILIADDQVNLNNENGEWIATCPKAIAGKIHLREIGILNPPHEPAAKIDMIFQSVQPAGKLSQAPDLGLPIHTLDFLAAAAAEQVEHLLRIETQR